MTYFFGNSHATNVNTIFDAFTSDKLSEPSKHMCSTFLPQKVTYVSAVLKRSVGSGKNVGSDCSSMSYHILLMMDVKMMTRGIACVTKIR